MASIDNSKTRRDTFNLWDLVHLILEIWWYYEYQSMSSYIRGSLYQRELLSIQHNLVHATKGIFNCSDYTHCNTGLQYHIIWVENTHRLIHMYGVLFFLCETQCFITHWTLDKWTKLCRCNFQNDFLVEKICHLIPFSSLLMCELLTIN